MSSMVAARSTSGRRWWLHAALVGLVVALGAGILGMHALTASHSSTGGHGTAAVGAVDRPPGTKTARVVPTDHHAPAASEVAVASRAHGIASVARGDAGTDCDASCEAATGSLCLAVLGALLVLALGRRGGVMGSRPRQRATRAIRISHLSRHWPVPSLDVLCISRT
jgi:hypothetical protein